MASEIRIAETDAQVASCLGVMRQLRPHVDAEGFVERVRRQMSGGYLLALLEDGGAVVTVAGYRYVENLAWGRHMYVDDLVTDEAARSAGHGRRMLDWLVDEARRRGCDELHLDSGVQRFGAHRFYLVAGMDITSHHFAMRL